MKFYCRTNKGSVLFMVVISSTILTIVGFTFIYVSESERIFARNRINETRAFYLAEAGVERAKTWFDGLVVPPLPENTYGTDPFYPFGVDPVVLEPSPPASFEGTYLVTIDPLGGDMYLVTSTGTVVGIVQKVVKIEVKFDALVISSFTTVGWWEEPLKRLPLP